jgi:hypothetical protein
MAHSGLEVADVFRRYGAAPVASPSALHPNGVTISTLWQRLRGISGH